jgi:hypothetical protein
MRMSSGKVDAVTIDVVQFFFGDAATEAARADHATDVPPPNDYWIRRASSAYGREEFDQLFEALPLRHARWSRPRSSPDCAGRSSPNSGYAIPPSRMNRCRRLG